jgi:integrase
MAYRYTLSTPDGELFDTASYAYPPNVGDVIHVHGGKRMWVTAFIPVSPLIGNRRVSEVTTDDLRVMVDELIGKKLALGTVTSIVNIVSRLFRFAKKRKLVEHNPVRDLDRDDRPGAHRETEPRYLTAAELEQLLAKLTDTMRPVAATCTFAALRISEALGLRWCDLDLKAGTITVAGQLGRDGKTWIPVPKTEASAATVPMLPVLQRELAAHRVRQAGRNLQWGTARRTRVHDDARQAAVQTERAPRRPPRGRSGRRQPRRCRACRSARPPTLVCRRRVRERSQRPGDRRARPAREREGDARDLRRDHHQGREQAVAKLAQGGFGQ